MKVETEREEDGRWIAEVPAFRGAMAYGATKQEAIAKVEALVLRALADKIEPGEDAPEVRSMLTARLAGLKEGRDAGLSFDEVFGEKT